MGNADAATSVATACYSCGHMQGLVGVRGRRTCDRQLQGNTIAVCKATFAEGSQERESCLNTAATMFGAVYAFQESVGGQLDNADACPGQV